MEYTRSYKIKDRKRRKEKKTDPRVVIPCGVGAKFLPAGSLSSLGCANEKFPGCEGEDFDHEVIWGEEDPCNADSRRKRLVSGSVFNRFFNPADTDSWENTGNFGLGTGFGWGNVPQFFCIDSPGLDVC